MNSSIGETRWSIFLTLFVLGLITAIVILPSQFHSEAGENKASMEAAPEKQKIYDIREDKHQYETLAGFRERLGKNAAFVADNRDAFVRGEQAIKTRIPNVKIEYNTDIKTPEVITPDVWQNEINFLSVPSGQKRSEILRGFLKQNNDLVGVTDGQADDLNVAADYTNPDGDLSYAHLEQLIDGVPVFRGEVKAGFTKDGRIIRVINNLAPGLDYASLSRDFKNPVDAVAAASHHLGRKVESFETNANVKESTDLKAVFGGGDWATTAEKMYFPTEPGIAVPAWRVLVWGPAEPHYVIVDAESGVMLWRKNIQDEQTQAATYQVYGNPNAFMDVADNPAPLSPGLVNPTLGTQGALIARTNKTLIGNEGDLSFNNNGWITDGTNITDGNFTAAGVDRDTTNGIDATQTGSPNRVFDSTWNPPPGNPAPGDDPLTPEAQRGAVIQMFYVMNRWHDELYKVGFTEAARNFQHDNFGRGGLANDRVSSEGQDNTAGGSSCPTAPCYNNANFNTPADGTRPRMQMYLWSGPTPDKDGTADAEIIIHEVTHGLSNRLHGNGSGLGNQGSMMGEGWGDWYANTLLAEPTDPINGIYATGGYATHLAAGGYTSNYYHGIRRFPRAVIAFTGPNGRPHNPLTFRYLNAGCDTLIGNTSNGPNSAYPRGPFGSTNACSQVHNAGEIWSAALWDVRALFVTRDGFQNGTRRVLQVVTDGMKLAPLGPTFLQERDAIIAAAAAMSTGSAGAVADVREGFRVRGMGFSASVQSNTAVTEAFDAANAVIVDPFSVSDSTGDNDGFPEPGESVLLNVSITNTTGSTVTNVVGNVTGGGSANYGTLAHNQTVSRQIAYTIPSAFPCGAIHSVTITATSNVGALTPQTRSFPLGSPVFNSPTQNFDSVTAPALPTGWTEVHSGASNGFVTTTTNATSAPNSVFANLPASSAEGILTGTAQITSASAQLSFRNRFTTEATWDGSVLEISVNGGPFQDIIAAGGTFVSGGYTGLMNALSPLAGRNAWNGTNAGVDTVINLPASANGQTVRFNFRTVSDTADTVANAGVWYDNMQLTGGNFLSTYTCSAISSNSSVSGRVVDSSGRSISRAIVTLTNGGNSIHAMTNTFGYFFFPVTATGTTYNVTVESKRNTFAPQTLTPTGNVTGLIITANP